MKIQLSLVDVALPKRPINQFRPMQECRQQVLRTSCPDAYKVPGTKMFTVPCCHLQSQEKVDDNSFECLVHVALPKRPINQFRPMQERRQPVLIGYCSNLYTVPGEVLIGYCPNVRTLESGINVAP